MPNGLTEGQMVERMYTELLGLDGKSGMVKEVADNRSRLAILETEAMRKADCKELLSGRGARKDKTLMRIKDFVLLAAGIMGLLFGSGILTK